MSILIKSGRIVTAEQDYTADIYIEKERITTIGAFQQTQCSMPEGNT